jgi:hypothetical protein
MSCCRSNVSAWPCHSCCRINSLSTPREFIAPSRGAGDEATNGRRDRPGADRFCLQIGAHLPAAPCTCSCTCPRLRSAAGHTKEPLPLPPPNQPKHFVYGLARNLPAAIHLYLPVVYVARHGQHKGICPSVLSLCYATGLQSLPLSPQSLMQAIHASGLQFVCAPLRLHSISPSPTALHVRIAPCSSGRDKRPAASATCHTSPLSVSPAGIFCYPWPQHIPRMHFTYTCNLQLALGTCSLASSGMCRA